ncbi:hypothetical protein N5P18_11905 [Janibacter terrae]|uniref:Uncharacterized protein n=1 Tax=Janibacter terrae TaxID=103817 RepID=A0ABZ2FAR1_9MICO|nr:hypothetical protein [Janibacter terrae]
MPPSHPRPEDLTALGAALSSLAGHAVSADEELLDHMVTVGDRTAQAAVDGLVDDAVDVLRELSSGCREVALSLGSHARAAAPLAEGAREHR